MQEEHQLSRKTEQEHGSDEKLAWRVHPLVENWKRSTLLFLFLCALLLIVYWGFPSPFIVFLSALFLFGSLYKYFLPFHYECEAEKLVVTACCYRSERPWTAFRSFYVDANGVLLSPFAKPTRLENFRGVYVRFGKYPSEEVVDFIHSKLNRETECERS